MKNLPIPRSWRALSLLAALSLAGGCDAIDDLLVAENPSRISEGALDDPALVPVLVASVVGQIQSAYVSEMISRGSYLTDEQVIGINDEQTARLNQRIVRYDEGGADAIFTNLSEARVLADTIASKLRVLLDNPASDRRLALVQAYAGYSYIALGEVMCEVSINVGSVAHTPMEIFAMAIPRLEEALQIATAAGDGELVNLARVGLARAHLNLGNNAQVMEYAADVPEDFAWWLDFSTADAALNNSLYGRTHGGNHNLGVHPAFLSGTFGEQNLVATQTDPRVQHVPSWSYGHNGRTRLYKPFQPLSFSGYTGRTVADICADVEAAECTEAYLVNSGLIDLPAQDTDVTLASGLEALHHYYEAAGAEGTGPAGTTLDFVNARRAFGNQPAVSLAGAELVAELRNQRGRDLYLGGFRLGDLRRWLREGTDLFPTGEHPVPEWGEYGDATCYPIPLEEYEGNPNLPRP